MSKPTEILEIVRALQEFQQQKFFKDVPNARERAIDFEIKTPEERVAWWIWYLRGIEEVSFLISEYLYPTIDTDNV